MAKKKKNSRENDGASLDMTPMIDVVFQLIIFFVVTLKTADTVNPDIVLEYGKNGPDLRELIKENQATPPITIEVRTLSEGQLRDILKRLTAQRGTGFPVLIRADKDTKHEDVRRVMNICGTAGLWKLSFVAMVEPGEAPEN